MKYLLLLFMMLSQLTGSCSMRGVLLTHDDWVACNRLDHYFNLKSKAQKEQLCKMLSAQLDRLKKDDLPQLVVLLGRVQQDLQHPVNFTFWVRYRDELMNWQRKAFTPLAEDVIKLFASLRPEQVAHFENRLTRDNRKYERLATAKQDFAEAQQRRIEEYMKNAASWCGPLRDEQKQMFQRHFQLPRTAWQQLWEYRRNRQQEFVSALTGSLQPDVKRDKVIEGLLIRLPSDQGLEASRAWKNFLNEFLPSLSAEQRSHLIRWLGGWHEDLRRYLRS
jgi:hypothetical protein